jgi:hypothetical protein
MNEAPHWALALAAGLARSARSSSAACGGRFARAFPFPRPALWFWAACCCAWASCWRLLLVAGGDWERLLLCLLGFVAGTPGVTWLTRPPRKAARHSRTGGRHAP